MTAEGGYNTVRFHLIPIFDEAFHFVWEKYKQLGGVYLSQLTHQADTAWSKADQCGEVYLNDQEIYEEEEYQSFAAK